ncbi:Uncharacterised protein [Vibrio cholerae]|nr:Uncharacterised protein [Vibrio cholerae]
MKRCNLRWMCSSWLWGAVSFWIPRLNVQL